MKRWLITCEHGEPFTVDALTQEQAIILVDDYSNWDIVSIYEVDIFSILTDAPLHNGLEVAK